MEIEKMNKLLFSNVHDLLANLPDKERESAIYFLNKKDILGNKTLEADVLFQYNAAVYQAMTYERVQAIYNQLNEKFNLNTKTVDGYIDDFNNAVQTAVNQATFQLNSEVGKTVALTNMQVGKLNDTVVSLVDNVSAYIDTSIDKMLTEISDERKSNENGLITYGDMLKDQLRNEVQGMIAEIVKNDFPDELKKSVKIPISEHLKHYSGTANKIMTEKFSDMELAVKGMHNKVQNMEQKVNGGHDPWNVMRVIRDIVVFGGVLLVAKLMHFI